MVRLNFSIPSLVKKTGSLPCNACRSCSDFRCGILIESSEAACWGGSRVSLLPDPMHHVVGAFGAPKHRSAFGCCTQIVFAVWLVGRCLDVGWAGLWVRWESWKGQWGSRTEARSEGVCLALFPPVLDAGNIVQKYTFVNVLRSIVDLIKYERHSGIFRKIVICQHHKNHPIQ